METLSMDSSGDIVFVASGVTTQKDTDGQITFVTKGATTDNKVGFLVSSKVLSLASDVFAALLSPRFREGQALARNAAVASQNAASQNVLEVALPEDDPVGLHIVFKILHHHATPAELTLSQLSATAKLVDKYRCSHAFLAPSRMWLDRHIRGIGAAKTLPEYLGIARAFGQADIEATVMLGIAMTTGSLNAPTCEERIRATALGDLIEDEYCGYIDRYRERLGSLLTSKVWNLATPLNLFNAVEGELPDHADGEQSRHAEMVTSAFYRALQQASISPRRFSLEVQPILEQVIDLCELASVFSDDARTTLGVDGFSPYHDKPDCTACNFVTIFNSKIFRAFMECVGSRRGRRSLGRGASYEDYLNHESYVLPTAESGSIKPGREYSEDMRVLFNSQLGYIVLCKGDGRSSLETLSATLRGQFDKHERLQRKKATPAKRKR